MGEDCPATLYFSFRTLAGEKQESLCEGYAGKVLLVVNTQSYCGFTPQYEGLEMLCDRYRERGFVELA
jgi:glutathione peroxidase